MSMSFLEPPPGQHESLDRIADAKNYNQWLLERLRPFVGRDILDFGAGIGTFTDAVAAHGNVVAVEPDPLFASHLKERFAARPNVTVVQADATWLEDSGRTGAFDTILCINVLEHIADHERVLQGFHDCIRPGGHLLLLVPAHPELYGAIDRSVGHERRYRRHEVRDLFVSAGLAPVDVRYVNPLGAVGWLVSSGALRRDQVPTGPLRFYDLLVPVLRRLDGLRLPFGLSVWAVGRRQADATARS